MTVSDLPILNAFLNATSGILLLIGRGFIKRGNTAAHRKTMISAFITSSIFLVSYLVYHGIHGAQYFQGRGLVRPLYFLILGTHTILAAAIVPLVLITLSRGLKGRYGAHKKIARWTYPVWLYVSVTGVVIYLMLYQLFPGGSIS
jgi:putative membrane protein